MPKISNSIDRFTLLNLGYLRGGKGPYAIRQEGYAPGSMTMDEDSFYLLEDGTWLINYAFFLFPAEEQERHLFGSLKEVFEAIDALAGQKVVVNDQLPEGATRAEILAGMRSAGNRLIQRLQEAKASTISR
ncbi:MAG: hypothetical protein ACQKBU_06695 [Verrucomicrobiales bacterium]